MRKGEGFGFGGMGFGIPGAQGADWPGDAATMARRFWDTLTASMRDTRGSAPAGDLWRSAMDGWSQLAGMAGGGGRDDLGAAIERFSSQARHWFAGMQQVAESFGGRQASPGDIVQAWKQAMGAAGDNPFANLFNAMPGRGQAGFDQWYAQVGPMLKAMGLGLQGGMGLDGMNGGLRRELSDWLHLPAFGMNREHEERLRALVDAQLELQRANDAYNALMLRAGHDAFDRFERKLAERTEPGRQLKSARALFDLWIDAAEEAYAEIALSHEFRSAYGTLVNAQMRVRAGVQREVENVCAQFGMPTRTEVDSAHRRIAELERQLRRMRGGSTASPAAKSAPATRPVARKAPAGESKASDAAATSAAPSAVANPAVKPAAKPAATPAARAAVEATVKPAAKATTRPAAKSAAKAAAKPVAKTSVKSAVKTASAKPRAARADAAPATRRAARPAIAIAMPDPLQPLPSAEGRSAGKTAAKTARTSVKRTR